MIRRSWLLFWRQFSLALKDVRRNLVMIILFWVQIVIIVVFSGLLVSMTWSEMGYKAWMEKLSGQNLYYFQNIGEVSYNAGTQRNLAEILSQTDYVMCSMITVSKGEDYYPAILIIGDSEFVLSDVNQSENDSGVTVLLGSGVENLAVGDELRTGNFSSKTITVNGYLNKGTKWFNINDQSGWISADQYLVILADLPSWTEKSQYEYILNLLDSLCAANSDQSEILNLADSISQEIEGVIMPRPISELAAGLF